MKKWLLLLLLPLLTGCSHTYLERQVYPICLSVDTTDAGQYRVGVQAPRSSEGENAYDILSGTGDTLGDALRVLAASTPYPLNFSQLRLCLIAYDLAATQPLRPLLRALFELPGMRPNAQVMVAMGSALETMQAQKPDFGQRLSTHLNLLFERLEREQTLPDSSLSACVRELGDGRSDLLLCLCAVNPSLQKQEDKPAFAVGEPWSDRMLPDNQIAGLLTRTGPNPVEYVGSAAVADGRVSGVLTARETQLAVRILAEAKRKVQLNPLTVSLILPRNGALEGTEDESLQLVRKLQSLQSDALLFGCEASKHFRDDASWQAFRFRSRYPTAAVTIATE